MKNRSCLQCSIIELLNFVNRKIFKCKCLKTSFYTCNKYWDNMSNSLITFSLTVNNIPHLVTESSWSKSQTTQGESLNSWFWWSGWVYTLEPRRTSAWGYSIKTGRGSWLIKGVAHRNKYREWGKVRRQSNMFESKE